MAWAAVYVAVVALLAWSRAGVLGYLIVGEVAAVAAFAAFFLIRRQVRSHAALTASFFFLAVAVAGAIPIAWQLQSLGPKWNEIRARHEREARHDLDARLALVAERGRLATRQAAQIPLGARPSVFARIEQLQLQTKVDALAIFGDSGELIAWAGEHRGRIPHSVRLGTRRVEFSEGPLYSYLYFAQARADSGRAVAAVLVDAAVPLEVHAPPNDPGSSPFIGRNAAFIAGPGQPGDWSFTIGNDTLFHARIEAPSQAEWRERLLRMAQRFEVVLALLVILLLAVAWFREPGRPSRYAAVVPFFGSVAAVVAAPIGGALALEDLFSPGLFLLPGPGTISLGTFLAMLVCSAFFVSTLRSRPRYQHTLVFVALALLLGLLLPVMLQLLVGPAFGFLARWQAATPTLLESGATVWGGLQAAVTLFLTLGFTFVLMVARWQTRLSPARRYRAALLLVFGGALVAGLLALLVLGLTQVREHVSAYFALLWALPVVLVGFGVAAVPPDRRRLVRWLLAGWIAATLTLPYVWSAQTNAQLRKAERDLATLGTRPDEFLEFLLQQFGREVIARRERGDDGLQLLYRSWVGSGLAREAYLAAITMWDSAGQQPVRLELGAAAQRAGRPPGLPPYLRAAFERVQMLGYPEVFLAPESEQLSQVLVVPLDRGRMVTVEVPPRRGFESTSVIAPLLGMRSDLTTEFELVPLREDRGTSTWRRIPEGWRSEAIVHYPEGDYHAHLTVRLPSFFVQVARGALIIAANMVLLVLLWFAGRVIRAEQVAPAAGWFGWLGTFRSRITATLFLFFLMPTATFGWVAYGALAREVIRAARVVAERAVRQAVVEFQDAQGDLGELAAHAGAEVLLYFQGELGSTSSPEALELGVFSVWVPPDVFLRIEGGDDESAVKPRPIGDQLFLTAYRRLQPAGTGIMAVPISLESRETVQRQREMAHLVMFAALVGGLLSLALSVVVGRTLAGPIGRLQRAAAAIGAGRLNVQLPEQTGDEFGRLYASFNRMVRRLRRARTQELRSARVLAWGEMARQVAHEIKNPLTPIKLAVQHLRRASADRRPDFPQVLEQSVDQILIEIDRLTEIARAFSRYGAPAESAGPLETVNVKAVVQEALTLYRTGDTRVRYLDELDPDLPPVFARAGELKEVLLNLLENARDASREGGTVVVSAQRDGLAVELCVRDHGVGIPADQLSRIFDPHFSTRTTGTGLGLPIVRRLVESWGGTVDAESEAGRGTTIRVRLRAVFSEMA